MRHALSFLTAALLFTSTAFAQNTGTLQGEALDALNLSPLSGWEVDVIQGNDFNTLLKKNQKSIVEVDRNYVQQFVKISSYLKTKKENIQSKNQIYND